MQIYMRHCPWLTLPLAAALVTLGAATACSSDPEATGGGGGSGTTTSSTSTSSTTTTTSSAGGGGSAPICEPADVSSFSHDYKPGVGLHQNQCTPAQIDELFVACFGPGASQTACDDFATANKLCVACALSTPESLVAAPLVLYQDYGIIDANPGQCVSAFEGDTSADSCGAKIDAAQQCGGQACLANCAPYDTQEDLNELLTCLDEASKGGCKSYQDAADQCSATLIGNGDPVDGCVWDEGNEDFFVYAKRLVTLECGPGSGGGGGGGGGTGGSGTGGAGGG